MAHAKYVLIARTSWPRTLTATVFPERNFFWRLNCQTYVSDTRNNFANGIHGITKQGLRRTPEMILGKS